LHAISGRNLLQRPAMNHVDKHESFDPEALRRKASEIRTISAESPPDNANGEKVAALNPLARKIAQQFRDDSYSPAMITGLLRLAEFAALLAIGYCIHVFYVSMAITVFYVA